MTKQISITHVSYSGEATFEDFVSRFENQLGHHDLTEYQGYFANKGYEQKVEQVLQSQQGTSGLMIFSVYDHGDLLKIKGEPRKARQYVIGNPLFAAKMTTYDIRAALYAPLRVLVYADELHEKVFVEYDLPSSLLGQFENSHIYETAHDLDMKMANLIESSFNDEDDDAETRRNRDFIDIEIQSF